MKKQTEDRRTAFIYRQITFDLPTFERLKEEQRKMEHRTGRTVTNSEALCALVARVPK